MQPQPSFGRSGSGSQSGTIVCAQCGAPMPPEMRFCRSCGNRLGEGPAEYTETVRLPHTGAAVGTMPFYPGVNAPLAQPAAGAIRAKRRLGFTGTTWLWIVLVAFFASGGLMSALVKKVGRVPRVNVTIPSNHSFLGVNDLSTAEGGVTFDNVEPPGSPADLAGLVGGDVITSFDGRRVTDDDALRDVLQNTPPGKTVEVIYIRDAETKKTLLTTMTQEAVRQLERAFASRPEGVGRLGFDTDNAHRTQVLGTNIYGVRLDDFNSSGPAALAGLQKGDIITAIDKVPIRTVEELVARIHRGLPYTTVRMLVMRGNEQLEIPVKLGK